MPTHMKRFPASNVRTRPTCTYCRTPGHTIDKCYKKHDYPPGYKPVNRSFNGSVNQVDSFPLSHGGNVTVAVKQGKGKQLINEELATNENNMIFTKDQYTQLLALLQ